MICDELVLRHVAPVSGESSDGQPLPPDASPAAHPGEQSLMAGESPGRRKFLGIHFACCQTYGRIYPNRAQTAYCGHCPRCGRAVRVGIGPGGSNQRFFTAQ